MGSLFPPRHVYFPSLPLHTSTIIFLHGRGSSGPELTSELSTLSLSDLSFLTSVPGRIPATSTATTSSATQGQKPKTKTIFDHCPSCRWVFPSARTRWSEKFQEQLCEWFDSDASESSSLSSSVHEGAGPAASTSTSSTLPLKGKTDTPTTAGTSQIPIEQLPGLGASVEYILRIIDEEIARLNGDASQVVLCGLSQGMTLGLAVLICVVARGIRLGGFVGAMGWFPMATRVKGMLDQMGGAGLDGPSSMGLADARIRAVQQLIIPQGGALPGENDNHAYTHTHPHNHPHIHHQEQIHAQGHQLQALLTANTRTLPYDIPIFLSHGEDDAWVDVTLGREAYDILHQRLGFTNVSWKAYTGADVQGHWLKEPEQGDAIVEFLRGVLSISSQGSARK